MHIFTNTYFNICIHNRSHQHIGSHTYVHIKTYTFSYTYNTFIQIHKYSYKLWHLNSHTYTSIQTLSFTHWIMHTRTLNKNYIKVYQEFPKKTGETLADKYKGSNVINANNNLIFPDSSLKWSHSHFTCTRLISWQRN